MSYNAKIIIQYWASLKLPVAVAEFQFHPVRKWKFDFAFPDQRIAVEVQGGIWTRGRHVRPAALKQEWEKLNTAAGQGWRILYCEPRSIATLKFARQVEAALCTEVW